jgi:hypothetical protein
MADFLGLSDAHNPIDVSDWEINTAPVAGRYPKHELINDNKKYIVKLAAYTQNNKEVPYHISEYVASRVIKSIGYAVQDVWMSEFHGLPSCLISILNESLITFDGLGTSTLSGENLLYDLDSMGEVFNEGKFSGDFEEYLWDTFLCDALINNLDRHPNNWGFFRRNGFYVPAPLFDNASALYSINAFTLNRMADIDDYLHKFGRSKIQYKGERASFREIVKAEKSPVFLARCAKFKMNIHNIDLSALTNIAYAWEQYSKYVDFVKQFLERQVKWFDENL